MTAADFILQTRVELQEKAEHWKDKELFLKLQRSYVSLQFDLPYFIYSEILDIQEGKNKYNLTFKPAANLSFVIGDTPLNYVSNEYFFSTPSLSDSYTFMGDVVVLSRLTHPGIITGAIAYKYEKNLENEQCEIEMPAQYHKALRFMLLSEIHEKPTLNTKQRNLSQYYMGLYEQEVRKLRHFQKTRPKNVTSKFQRI